MTECELFTWEAFSCNAWLIENEHKIWQKKCLKFDGMYLFSRFRIKSPYFNSGSPRCGMGIRTCPIKFLVSFTRPDLHNLRKQICWRFFVVTSTINFIAGWGDPSAAKYLPSCACSHRTNWKLGPGGFEIPKRTSYIIRKMVDFWKTFHGACVVGEN